ncbi:MAG: aspartate/glutamate racemase family protein [Firmicutes bacterium]|nr:aspartate/glutamate racemase family protein [Bacillota bacterium]
MNAAPIGIFDSGAGGLTTLSACRRILPFENFIYLSDQEFAPYGNKSDSQIAERVFACSQRLLDLGCKAVVVACNTATNVGIKLLRTHFARPFVGLEPAVKPACEYAQQLDRPQIVLFCTQATARQEKFLALYQKYCAYPSAVVSPQKDLARLIENHLLCPEKIRGEVYKILTPYKNADIIILGCTHYILIQHLFQDFYLSQGRPVRVFHGNLGAANRLKYLLTQDSMLTPSQKPGKVCFM